MDCRNYKVLKKGRYQSVGILENTYVFEIKTGIADVPEYYRITKKEFDTYDQWKDEWITDKKTIYTIVNRKCFCSAYKNHGDHPPRNYHFAVVQCPECKIETVAHIGHLPLGARYEVTCPQCVTIFSKTKD